MHGPSHKALRKSFLSLFTPKALSTYVSIQARTPKRPRPGFDAPDCVLPCVSDRGVLVLAAGAAHVA